MWSEEEEEEEIDTSDEESLDDDEEEEEVETFLFFFNLKNIICEIIFIIGQKLDAESKSVLPPVWLRLDCKARMETEPDNFKYHFFIKIFKLNPVTNLLSKSFQV